MDTPPAKADNYHTRKQHKWIIALFIISSTILIMFVLSLQVLNLTQAYIARHQKEVVPLIEKYAEEWLMTGSPIYRPMWWLSPSDPMTFTIDDQFLIGDKVT